MTLAGVPGRRRGGERPHGARWALGLVAAASVAFLGTGCRRDDAKKRGAASVTPAIPRLEEPARARAAEACGAYVRDLCACAQGKPELAPTCELDSSLVQGVATMLRVEAAVTEADKLQMAQRQIQRMTATCVERHAQLPAQGCR